jgi:hypothetical protein
MAAEHREKTMREIRITLRCVSHPTQHAKVVRVKARLGKRRAQELADLLDGTSLAYVHPPGPNSPIGRCCICGDEIEAQVSEIVNGEELKPSCTEAAENAARKEAAGERKLKEVLKVAAR